MFQSSEYIHVLYIYEFAHVYTVHVCTCKQTRVSHCRDSVARGFADIIIFIDCFLVYEIGIQLSSLLPYMQDA